MVSSTLGIIVNIIISVIYIYIYIFIQTNIHTNKQTYIQTNIQTNIHTNIHKYVRTYIHTYIHTYIYIYIYRYIYTVYTYRSKIDKILLSLLWASRAQAIIRQLTDYLINHTIRIFASSQTAFSRSCFTWWELFDDFPLNRVFSFDVVQWFVVVSVSSFEVVEAWNSE